MTRKAHNDDTNLFYDLPIETPSIIIRPINFIFFKILPQPFQDRGLIRITHIRHLLAIISTIISTGQLTAFFMTSICELRRTCLLVTICSRSLRSTYPLTPKIHVFAFTFISSSLLISFSKVSTFFTTLSLRSILFSFFLFNLGFFNKPIISNSPLAL